MPPMNSNTTTHPERLAIHLGDVERVEPMLRHRLLGGRLDLSGAIKIDGQPAVAFSCDLLTAALACDLIQSGFREEGDSPARIYLSSSPGAAWNRVGSRVMFTVTDDAGKASLNPDVFPSAEVKHDYVPLPVQVIEW